MDERCARIEQAAKKLILSTWPTDWDDIRLNDDVDDAHVLHDDLREALGISVEEWQAAITAIRRG